MNEELYNAARVAVKKLQNIEIHMASLSDQDGADTLYKARRELEIACNTHMQQGDLIELTSSFQLACPECNENMNSSDMLYVHLRKDHDLEEEDAAVKSHQGKGGYDTEVATLRELLPKHTGVMIHEEDPFFSSEEN